VTNPRIVARNASLHDVTESVPQAPADGPKASEAYQNVKLLGHLSAGGFTRLMVSMTQWIAPTEGCNYCHNSANFADDSNYRKVVARRMIEMTWKVNADWKQHVAETGVTCYTCHRGHGVPQLAWSQAAPARHANRMLGNDFGQNHPAASVKLASLPYDPLSLFLERGEPIRVASTTALPTGTPLGIKRAEQTYALMFHISDSLGVNCTFCHNTRSFAEWDGAPPTRATAWYGIRMARQINTDYIDPLKDVFPAARLGPMGDPLKVGCATCHQGISKPLRGVSMLQDHPALAGAPAQ
jgi:photosynthetic reaction center cytochrome c subunit